jgi:hypothetical protein
MSHQPLRSVSFDTSFLLRDIQDVDAIIKNLAHYNIPAFITATVLSELEQLKIWGRITPTTYKTAMKRIRTSKATVIDFTNRLLANTFGAACTHSMEEHLGVRSDHVVNDCRIMITTLKNGINLFLSEDYHFTSPLTNQVIKDVTNAACSEFHQLCTTTQLFSVNSATFLRIYKDGKVDLDLLAQKI